MSVPTSRCPVQSRTHSQGRQVHYTHTAAEGSYATYVVVRCPSVWVSVTFLYSVETNKHIFKFFSPSSSHTFLPYQTAIFLWGPGGVECRRGRHKSQFLTNIWLWHRWLVTCHQQFRPSGNVYHSRCWRRSVNLVYDSKARRHFYRASAQQCWQAILI